MPLLPQTSFPPYLIGGFLLVAGVVDTKVNQEISMNMTNIRAYATLMGIESGKLVKPALIKKIQTVEGNFDCYATARTGECDQASCIWQKDCFDAACVEVTP